MSSPNLSWKQKATSRRINSSNRLLHASGVSILAMADIVYEKALEMDGPLGSTWRRMAKLAEPANPIICAIQSQWLAILSFLDDQFLVVRKIIETLFPPSSHLFTKTDDLVFAIISLPEKFDEALNKLPEVIHLIPCLECVLLYLISWLNWLVSMFNLCGLDNSRIKDIPIDENTIRSERSEAPNCGTDKSERTEDDECDKGRFSSTTSELEASEATQKKRGSKKEASVRDEDECMDEKGRRGRMKEEDPILGLFESRWIT